MWITQVEKIEYEGSFIIKGVIHIFWPFLGVFLNKNVKGFFGMILSYPHFFLIECSVDIFYVKQSLKKSFVAKQKRVFGVILLQPIFEQNPLRIERLCYIYIRYRFAIFLATRKNRF